MPDQAVMENPLPGILLGCFSTSHPNFSSVLKSGGIITGFQVTDRKAAIYFFLTVYKFFGRFRSFGWSLTPLLKVFFRHRRCRVLCNHPWLVVGHTLLKVTECSQEIMTKALYASVTILFVVGPEKLQGIAGPWVVAVIAVTLRQAGRLVFNIRDVAKPPDYYRDSGQGPRLQININDDAFTAVIELSEY
ncbi:hypothetical protein BU17DRAFT_61069 [Hysterangium stoloniferum]|nr:hypothetical protein BU17DRAFT_61069 [Hysterangium stoloniferum]